MTRLGVVIVPTDPWPVAVEQVRRVEELGYHHLWTYDHLSWRRYRDEPWHATHPWLTGMAALTSRIRLGTMVSNPSIRHPLLLAKDAMTIDHVAGGRLTIGLGAGGVGYDAAALGRPELTPGARMDRLTEFVRTFDALLRDEIREHHGEYYDIDGARLLPGCVQRPRVPLALAAGGPRGIALAAEVAEAWITLGDTVGRDFSTEGTERAIAEQSERLDEACAAIGRDPAGIDRIVLLGGTEFRPTRSLEEFTDAVGRLAAVGITDVVVHHPRAEDPNWDDDPELLDAIADAFL